MFLWTTNSRKTRQAPQKLRMARSVYQQIQATIGRLPAETGGAMGGSLEDGVVRHFFFDRTAT